MKITIGILAWNEEENIKNILPQLLQQTIFNNSKLTSDLLLVANGCTDKTAQVAKDFKNENPLFQKINFQIVSIEKPGKANAWNQLIHNLSDKQTDIYINMDADITLPANDTLERLIEALQNNPMAKVISSLPIKEITNKTLINHAVKGQGEITKLQPGQLCGHLYAINGETARGIILPTNIIIDDGFIKEMVVTDLLKKLSNNELVQTSEKVPHFFKPYADLRSIFKNQVRQTVGQSLYHYLKEWLLKNTQERNIGVSDLISKMNTENPDWLRDDLIEKNLAKRWWVIPARLLFWPFIRLKNLSFLKQISKLPVAFASFLFGIPVCFVANRKLKKGEITNIWR